MTGPARGGSAPLMSLLRKLRRAVSWHRRAVAALLTFIAVLGVLRVVSAPDSPGSSVVTVSADTSGGSPLTRDQLTVRSVPPDLVPGAALTSLDQAEGRTPTGPLSAGTILTEPLLVGPGLSATGPGRVVVPARLADAGIVGVLRVGDAIDVMATDPGTGQVTRVASRARIATVPTGDDGGPFSASSPQDEVLVLLEVTQAESLDLTRAAATSRLSVVLPHA